MHADHRRDRQRCSRQHRQGLGSSRLRCQEVGRRPADPADITSIDYLPCLTIRMLQRLQNFPDEWAFSGDRSQQIRQIANAFPPRLARSIAQAIYTALTGVTFDRKSLMTSPLPRGSIGATSPKINLNAGGTSRRMVCHPRPGRRGSSEASPCRVTAGRKATHILAIGHGTHKPETLSEAEGRP